MLDVIGRIAAQHDLRLVFLAALLCFFSCFTAINTIARARAAQAGTRWLWLGGAAILTGSGIWATHFVTMLGYKTSLDIGFDFYPTALSGLAAIVLSVTGYWLSLNRPGPVLGGLVVGAAIGVAHYIGVAAMEIHADAAWSPIIVAASIALGMGGAALALFLATRDT